MNAYSKGFKPTSKSSVYFFSGETKYPKLTEIDKYGKYGLQLKMNDSSMEAFAKSGLKLKVDAEGYVRFGRKSTRTVKGAIEEVGPPQVLDKDNKPFPNPKSIGNGSTVTVKVEVYFLEKLGMMGHRLEVVRVDELVPYTGGATVANAPDVGAPF